MYIINIHDKENCFKLIPALNEVTGLWDVEAGLKAESERNNPFFLGSIRHIKKVISYLPNVDNQRYNNMKRRLRPFWDNLVKRNQPTVKNPGNYYGNLFRFIYGFDKTPKKVSFSKIFRKKKKKKKYSYLKYFDRLSFNTLDHELMYALCKVILNSGISGFGIPYILSYNGMFVPEIVLCDPPDVLLPVMEET